MTTKQNKGFTLLEILLVIAAIGILAAIVLVAINPNRQLAQARNAQRRADINTIYKALEQYLIDNGSYPNSVNSNFKEICNTGTEQVGGATDCTNKADLRALVSTYLAAIPTAPRGGAYGVGINPQNNRISTVSLNSELEQSIVINPPSPWMEGGDSVYTINVSGVTYRVHEFKTVGTSSLNVINGGNVEYLIVAAGGGGGRAGGGGGGGGLLTNVGLTPLALASNNYPIIVGGPGARLIPNINSFPGNDGGPSSAFGLTAIGGGGGASRNNSAGRNGGSGGGATQLSTNTPGLGTSGQGSNGGFVPAGSTTFGSVGGSGGGGAGGPGGPGPSPDNNTGGTGGIGLLNSITGQPIGYSGGGGGGSDGTAIATDGGGSVPADAVANRGGGGRSTNLVAYLGGSGIVIVRYPLP